MMNVVFGGVTWYGVRDNYGQFVIGMLGKANGICIYLASIKRGRFWTVDVVCNYASITFLSCCFEIETTRLMIYDT
jgi:hypothetical protein